MRILLTTLLNEPDYIRLKSKGTGAETEILRGYAHRYFNDIMKLLVSVPSDLLLVLKTNDCLRHLDNSLGAPINSAIGIYVLKNCICVLL